MLQHEVGNTAVSRQLKANTSAGRIYYKISTTCMELISATMVCWQAPYRLSLGARSEAGVRIFLLQALLRMAELD